jgi:hypothetical protein
MQSFFVTSRVLTAIGLLLASLPLASAQYYAYNPDYSYTNVAVVGQSGITGILGGPSINGSGKCAFPATVSGGQSVFVGNGSLPPVNITSGFISASRHFGSFLQINDADIVAAQDQYSGNSSYFIRNWNADSPGTFTILAQAGNGGFVQIPSLNNNGQAAYLEYSGTNYSIFTTNTTGQTFYYHANLTNNIFRPFIADNGSIVGKLGSATTSGFIQVYNSNLTSVVNLAGAGANGNFSSLDSLPGISEDGQEVAFNGSDASGPGIFLATAGSTGFSAYRIDRIVGTPADGLNAFATFSRVAVKTLPQNQLGFVAYLGTKSGISGLYITEFQSLGLSLPPLVSLPNVVVTNGQTLPGLTGTVQSLSIQDPINTNGDVAFFVQTTTGAQAIVLAAPTGLVILPTFDSSITSLPDASAVEASIGTDINTIDSDITANNPVTVTIDFKAVSTGLAASLTPPADLPYSTYLAALQANPVKTALNVSALANMPAGPGTGINGATQVLLTAANLAAIGQTSMASSLVAGNGGFNSVISLNFSIMNDSRPDADHTKYDLQSIAAHEINEVLGIGGNATTLYQPGPTPPATLPMDVGPLDFFRFSANGVLSFTYNANGTAYFSIDGGLTSLVNFNQQGMNGADFGDWGNNNVPQTRQGNTPPQAQDAFGTPGAEVNLGVNEMIALNVVGWTLSAPAQPPTLNLVFIPPNQILISWTNVKGFFELQQSPSLTSPSWGVVSTGSGNSALIQVNGTQQFYQLFSPAAGASIIHAANLTASFFQPNNVAVLPLKATSSKVVPHLMLPRNP